MGTAEGTSSSGEGPVERPAAEPSVFARGAAPPRCLDCGQPVVGPFCSSCGQRVQTPIKPLREFLREGLAELISVDGPQLRSLRALVATPGALSVDYLAGRRTRYVHPVRIFVQVGVAAYLVTRLLPTESSLFGVGPELFGDESSLAEALLAAALIPVGAGAHWLALRSVRPLLLEHVVFVLHLMAFSFLLAPLEGLLFVLVEGHPWLESAAALMAPTAWGIYWVAALRRFTSAGTRDSIRHAFRVYIAALLITAPVFVYELLVSS